jgi:hypothetical protein
MFNISIMLDRYNLNFDMGESVKQVLTLTADLKKNRLYVKE